jgi:hypothetical protein
MRIVVAGGRDFNNYALLKEKLDYYLQNLPKENIIIISGTAKGADSLGERYAAENGLKCERFPADWNKHGKKAGILRNEDMANQSDALIAFYDGQSRGTGHMIGYCKRKGLKVKVVKYDNRI